MAESCDNVLGKFAALLLSRLSGAELIGMTARSDCNSQVRRAEIGFAIRLMRLRTWTAMAIPSPLAIG
jgi:hypothetical protein